METNPGSCVNNSKDGAGPGLAVHAFVKGLMGLHRAEGEVGN